MKDNETRVNPPDKKLLRDIRRENQVTQEELAQYLDWHQADLSKLETGKQVPDWYIRAVKLQLFLKKYGYSLEDLPIPDNEGN
jgi:transcriptional regulator with XRE-family HTH domain